MRIAIVDDIQTERKTLRNDLETQLSRCLQYAEIYEYEDGSSFLATARTEPFTLVFLDIYMEGKNGVETAKKLREFDTKCLLVFVTASTDYALDGFRVRAMQYLVKPYRQEELAALLREAIERLPDTDPYLDLRTANGPIRLRLREILYAEHFQHQMHIYTDDGAMFAVRQTFREFAASLNDNRFLLCNRGTIINLEHAEDFSGTSFLLKGGKKIPVSRSLTGEVRQAFADFLFQRRVHS